MAAAEPRYASQLYFDPDQHPEETLKSFEEFTQVFELRYAAQYPDPPKVSMDSAIQRWKFANATPGNNPPNPTLAQYDQVRDEWQSKDKVAKLLGMFSSNRLYTDWKIAKPNETDRKAATWNEFVTTMRDFYKPTENQTLTNYHFRQIMQRENETFPAFCNRVLKEVKHCSFNCHHADCTASTIAARDQIVIGTTDNAIREAALKKSWDLDTLRREGMKMESAARGGAEISGEAINKLGKYSYSNIGKNKRPQTDNHEKRSCFNCGSTITGSIIKHRETCPARESECHGCHKIGHFSKVCRSSKTKPVQQVDVEHNTQAKQQDNDLKVIDLFRIQVSDRKPKPQIKSTIPAKHNFKTQVVINGVIDSVIADTGASVCVCGTVQARKWKLLNDIQPSAKLVRSTSANHVLPALADIYDNYGNPNRHISDNGPPFNSKAMEEFATKRDIQTQFIPPLHPQANPVETFMKPLGKTMKIAHSNHTSEKEAVQQLLQNYRDTPHPATGVPPSTMLFRDSSKSTFPRATVSEESIKLARHKDAQQKMKRDSLLNQSKFRQLEKFTVGDVVMMRNHRRSSKFDPYFIPEPFDVIEVSKSNILTLVKRDNGSLFRRHPDDVKKANGLFPIIVDGDKTDQQALEIEMWHRKVGNDEEEGNGDDLIVNEHVAPIEPRRSERLVHQNRRYFNDDFEN